MAGKTLIGAIVLALSAAPAPAAAGPEGLIARWTFDEGKGDLAGDAAGPSTAGKIQKASWTEGKSGSALSFEDWSLKNYLKPDVREATRVVVPHDGRLNPAGPFTARAFVYPTLDPIYYGGILEKGRGYGASYRLLLLRGLKVRAVLGAGHAGVTSAQPISLNAWHEIEMIYDGSSLVLKVDGKEQGRSAVPSPSLSSKDETVIGDRFSGKIDEISITVP